MNGLMKCWLIGGGIGLVGCCAFLFGPGWEYAAIAAMWVPVIVATFVAFALQSRRLNSKHDDLGPEPEQEAS